MWMPRPHPGLCSQNALWVVFLRCRQKRARKRSPLYWSLFRGLKNRLKLTPNNLILLPSQLGMDSSLS